MMSNPFNRKFYTKKGCTMYLVVILTVVFLALFLYTRATTRTMLREVGRKIVPTRIPRHLQKARKWLIANPPVMSRRTTRKRLVMKLIRAMERPELIAFVVDTFRELLETGNSRHLKVAAIEGLSGVKTSQPMVNARIAQMRARAWRYMSPQELMDTQEVIQDEEDIIPLSDGYDDELIIGDVEEELRAA